MYSENLDLVQDEDEDVILEGSDLHQALTNMGYTNFDSIRRVKAENTPVEKDLSTAYQLESKNFSRNVDLFYYYVWEDDSLRKEQLEIILKGNILLDDHAAIIHTFVDEQQTSRCRKIIDWLPLFASTAGAIFYTWAVRKKSIETVVVTSTVLGFSVYGKFKRWIMIRNLRHLVTLQNELHDLLKQGLKILRRTIGRKAIVTEVHEKHELLGNQKFSIILSIKQLMIEIFKCLSQIYYQQASTILNILPECLYLNFILTKIETQDKQADQDENYDELKSLYYSFILVQSEMMFIMANAYHGKAHNSFFRIPKMQLSQTIKNLIKPLTNYRLKLSKSMRTYELCEIKPVRQVFRGVPNSKWQDTYVHLDLTSQRIQLAYNEISSILEVIDMQSEKNEDNLQLVESITEKMNEAYKQIENARNFTEFTSLLIAKAQRKPVDDSEKNDDNENLFPVCDDNRTIVMVDKDLEIEDEVFEEYIREEYLKPLYENTNGSVVENFKLDKLLKKNFMSELKEALIEKQKSMSERELKALKRMYNGVRRDFYINKTDSEKPCSNEKLVAAKLAPPPPPPPPPILINRIIAENDVKENEIEERKNRTPVPLPRVKMYQLEDEMPNVQRFSLSECTPNFKFLPFKVSEETFLGSGENSDEEIANSDNENDDENDEDINN